MSIGDHTKIEHTVQEFAVEIASSAQGRCGDCVTVGVEAQKLGFQVKAEVILMGDAKNILNRIIKARCKNPAGSETLKPVTSIFDAPDCG